MCSQRDPVDARSIRGYARGVKDVWLLLAAAVPFMGGVGILGLIIIAIGLYEAWKLNRRPRLAVTGPHALAPQAWRR